MLFSVNRHRVMAIIKFQPPLNHPPTPPSTVYDSKNLTHSRFYLLKTYGPTLCPAELTQKLSGVTRPRGRNHVWRFIVGVLMQRRGEQVSSLAKSCIL